ncbi:unnamed protein product [Leptidea sinapis]|uniref:Uncharacterized protein n=1 Tax=Leptidea sinapis TaxID=189913 RepID=A0A5E4QZ16_9NEOP|nr:unnamed protein product [Leptidea sinapis]
MMKYFCITLLITMFVESSLQARRDSDMGTTNDINPEAVATPASFGMKMKSMEKDDGPMVPEPASYVKKNGQ